MTIATSLRDFLITGNFFPNIANIGKIQYAKIDKSVPKPVIWFQRSGGSTTRFANGDPQYTTDLFDVEIVTDSDGSVFGGPEGCQELTAAVRNYLDGYRGVMGSDVVQWIKVTDQSDDYIPKLVDRDNGIYPFTLAVEIRS